MKRKQIILCLLLFLLTTAVNRVGATTYRLQRVTSVETGQKYVFEQCGYVMNNSISSNALQTSSSFNTTYLTGNEAYVWEVKSQYRLQNVNKGSSGYLCYSDNLVFQSSSTAINFQWTFSAQSDGTFIVTNNNSSDKLLGYLSPSSYQYKIYDKSRKGEHPYAIVAYKLVVEDAVKTSPELHYSSMFVKCVKGDAVSLPTLSKAAGHDGTVTYSSTNEQVATVDADGNVTIVGVGRTLITASSAATDSYDAGEATYTLQVMGGDGTEAKPHTVSDFHSGHLSYTAATPQFVKGYIVGYSKETGGTAITTVASDDSKFVLADTKGETDVSNAIVVTLSSDIRSSYGLSSHPDLMKCGVMVCGKVGYNVASLSISSASSVRVLTDAAKVTDAKYATFTSPRQLDFTTTGLQAYTVVPSATQVTLQPIEDGIVPAGKAVVLYGEPDTYDVPVTKTAATVTETGLSISDGSTAKGDGVYVLTKKNEAVGFGRWISASSLSKGKVYLKYPAEAPEFLSLSFGDVSVIGAVPATKAVPADSRYYNLQGQQVAHPRHGVYVVNGQKVIIK